MTIKIIVAIAMVGIISWLIDVFGRTMTPVHPKGPQGSVTPIHKTWNGRIAVIHRSDIPTSLHW